ncbi:MAG: hypothetical protein ACM34I_03445, partial [bacterium]
MLTKVLREIYRTNLAVKRNERALVFTDLPARGERLDEQERAKWERLKDIAMLAEETGRGFARDV